MKIIPIIIFIATLGIYLATSAGNTPYNYFTRLADAFLHGKYYLTDNPPWLSELIPLGNYRFTFVNPPMPAILALPFLLILEKGFQQQYLAHILGALTLIVVWALGLKVTGDKLKAFWLTLFFGFGTIFWYLSATGSVWYLGQVTCVFFLTLAIHETFGHKRLFLVGCFLAAAFFSRLQVTLSLPFFVLMLRDKINVKNILWFGFPLVLFLAGYLSYNYLRFGNPLQNGYTLIPGILKEPWFNRGQFSLSYISKHLQILFWGLPKTADKFPYIWPSWAGMSILITSPAFIFSLRASFKKLVTVISWVSILLVGLVNFSYGSTGFSQFGYRYAVDFYPFLLLLTILGIGRGKLRWYHWALLVLSIIVNLWGVLWINKFGWVSF